VALTAGATVSVTEPPDNALMIPVGALFRTDERWATFVIRDGQARATVVKIGRRNNQMAEVLDGLSPQDQVILHPSDRIRDKTTVQEREKS
jgi:HlyD family secretion protein